MSGAKKKLERRAQMADMGMTERQKQELKEQQAKRRNTILAVIGGAVAVVLVVVLLLWNSRLFQRNVTALTVKDHTFTVADMDYYYTQALNNQYSSEQYMAQLYAQNGMEYESSFDITGDLTQQYVDEEQTQSYHDYFKEQAKENVVQICALYDAAKAAGYTLSESAQSQLDTALTDLDAQVKQYNFGSRSAYLRQVYGRNMTEGVYMSNLEMNVLASDYYNSVIDQMGDYSDEELNAYYAANPGKFDSYDYDYVYFDGTVSSTDEEGNVVDGTEEEQAAAMAEAQSQAQSLLSAVKAAQSTTPAEGEDALTFDQVATAQGASATPRAGVMGSNFASAVYADWLMDSARTDGDTEVFELEGSGWYVIQFHKRYLDNDPTVDVRHILASYEADETVEHEHDENGQHTYTDAEKDAAKAQAQTWLDEYLAGEQTAEAFGELAEQYSGDGRDEEGNLYSPGGLYEGVTRGYMVQPFEDWIFDSSRQPGDTGLVQTDFGWHVMYFQALNRPAWMDQANSAKQSEEQEGFMDSAQAGYEAVEGSGWSSVGRA